MKITACLGQGRPATGFVSADLLSVPKYLRAGDVVRVEIDGDRRVGKPGALKRSQDIPPGYPWYFLIGRPTKPTESSHGR